MVGTQASSGANRPPRRPRRTSAEVRALVRAAAVSVFAEDGFGGATTREIAQRAGVAESTMFRIYPTKEALYEAAVTEPFDAFITRFSDAWLSAPVPGGDPREVLRQFVTEVRQLVREHRPLIAAVNADTAAHPSLQSALDRLEQVGYAIAEHYALEFDVAVAVRIATLAVVSTSMLEESVFPEAAGFTSDRVVDELVRMLVGATLYSPDGD